jgi:hypothetical protein
MPDACSAEMWTKRSADPLSGVMKPKPLSELKNFTVPVATAAPLGCRNVQQCDLTAALATTSAFNLHHFQRMFFKRYPLKNAPEKVQLQCGEGAGVARLHRVDT